MSAEDTNDVTYEYAIELPDQGWLHCVAPFAYSVVAEPVIISSQADEAQRDFGRARAFYSRIGAASIGDQLRLVVRSVAVVRSGWADA